MIFQVLQIVKEEVSTYLEDTTIALGNIANVAAGEVEDDEDADIILSLLNIDEEATLKNIPNYTVEGNTISYKNPKVNINLYVIFSANNQLYVESLKSISKVIEFFQGKSVFTHVNSNFNRDDADMQEIGNFKFITELYTPSFEQLSYIWGILGGKQYPSVIYKIRLLEIERDAVSAQGSVITEIGATLNKV